MSGYARATFDYFCDADVVLICAIGTAWKLFDGLSGYFHRQCCSDCHYCSDVFCLATSHFEASHSGGPQRGLDRDPVLWDRLDRVLTDSPRTAIAAMRYKMMKVTEAAE